MQILEKRWQNTQTKLWSENPIFTISGPYDVIIMTHQNFENP